MENRDKISYSYSKGDVEIENSKEVLCKGREREWRWGDGFRLLIEQWKGLLTLVHQRSLSDTIDEIPAIEKVELYVIEETIGERER